MKKLIIFTILFISAVIAANAATYRAKFDAQTRSETSFVVKVQPNTIQIRNNTYSLRRMGTITNSGYVFESYAYGSGSNGMFCVSTSKISVQINPFKTVTGYMMIIDGSAYLVDRIN